MRALRVSAVLVALAACGGAPASTTPVAPAPAAPPAPAPPAHVTWDQLHGPIRSVSLTGGSAADYTRLQPLFNEEVGRPLDRAQLRTALDQAVSQQTLADIEVSGEQLADGVRLIIMLKPQPTVTDVTVRELGGQHVDIPNLKDAIVGKPLDPNQIDAALAGMRDTYVQSGNAAFDAKWRATQHGDGVAIAVDVSLGEALKVSAHTFTGNAHVKTADLEHALGGGLAIGTPWVADHLEAGALLLSTYYFDHGYVNMTITAAPPPAHNPAPVAFDIKEGDQFHYGKIELVGIDAAAVKKYAPLLKLKAGAVFSRSDVIAALSRVHDAIVAAGHPRVEVLPLTEVDQKTAKIALKVQITLDPQ